MSIVVGALVMLATPAALLAGYILGRCAGQRFSDFSLGADGVAAPPASKESIEALLDAPHGGGDGQRECAICLEEEEDHDAAASCRWKEMPCGHQFHGACVRKWLRVHGSCPVCRDQMPPAPPGEESAMVAAIMAAPYVWAW